MNQKKNKTKKAFDILYDNMDWSGIEALEYKELSHPFELLGPHVTKQGILIQTFHPEAEKITVVLESTGKEYPMEKIQEPAPEGFFACLISRKTVPEYSLIIEEKEGEKKKITDPYTLFSELSEQIPEDELVRFSNGISYKIYDYLGAHLTKINGDSGVFFALWAPNALQVSVVGDFNEWDGRCHQMELDERFGIFSLFIPGLTEDTLYKYEIRSKGNHTEMKTDPYAFRSEQRPGKASIVTSLDQHSWKDSKWLLEREKKKYHELPLNIYEISLGDLLKDGAVLSEVSADFASYVKNLGYTHVELLNLMPKASEEVHAPIDSFYAISGELASPKELMAFVDELHANEIGVILDWSVKDFAPDVDGLSQYDGTSLYEHLDARQGYHPLWNSCLFNYGRPQVSNFLIANAMFWVDKYHIDGIRTVKLDALLYMDYEKEDGEWLPNAYGSNENLDAVELIKHLNSQMREQWKGVLLFADDASLWSGVTQDVEEDGLGFDYKWNYAWRQDVLQYFETDTLFRSGYYQRMIFSMVYAYSENFLLPYSRDLTQKGGRMLERVFGEGEMKLADLRLAYAYQILHPGKKLVDFGTENISAEAEPLPVVLKQKRGEKRPEFYQFIKELNEFYKNTPALYELDEYEDGFEWINNLSSTENILVFLRKAQKKEELLLVVANFVPNAHEKYRVGVPFEGKYKEVFNTDAAKYGGEGIGNSRVKFSKEMEWDERPYCIEINVPKMGIVVFSYTGELPLAEKLRIQKEKERKALKEQKEREKKEKKKAKKKASVKERLTAQSEEFDSQETVIKEKSKEAAQEVQEKTKGRTVTKQETVEEVLSKEAPEERPETETKPKRGRRKKTEPEKPKTTKRTVKSKAVEEEPEASKPRRGRKKKVEPEMAPETETKPKRGRRKKAEPEVETEAPKPKRGRRKKAEPEIETEETKPKRGRRKKAEPEIETETEKPVKAKTTRRRTAKAKAEPKEEAEETKPKRSRRKKAEPEDK